MRTRASARHQAWDATDQAPEASLRHPSVQPLTPAEEAAHVEKLCVCRKELDKLLKAVVATAPESLAVDHFDQRMTFALANRIRTKLGKAERRKFDKLLAEYSDLKHQLVVRNLRWVTKLARLNRQSLVSFEDLFQEGVCGLLKAIDRFEANREFRLMTYATWYIREAMQQARAKQTHSMAISSHDQTLLGQLEEYKTQYVHEHEKAPASSALAELFGRPRWTLDRLQQASGASVSVERSAGENGLSLSVDGDTAAFDDQEETDLVLRRLLDCLPDRERMVVSRRFGLLGAKSESLEDLGNELHVTKERVRQLQRQAIRRMQEEAEKAGLGADG